ncbi:MAG: glycosyltransferase family 4 protein [Candidatus Heimdallarchaeota archaeon]|nr:glycosyltransferase family 4 protein [Candidatus Heimdallarchaeota archaeon]
MAQKPWNILMVVLSTVSPDVRVEKEARFLTTQGHNVTVIGIDKTGKLPKNEKRDGYTIFRVPSTKKIFFKYFEFWKNVRKMIGKQQYDVVHFHDLNTLPLAGKLSKNSKIMIYDSHENFPEQMSETFGFLALWAYTLLEKVYIKKVHGIVTAGETYSDNLERKYGVHSAWIANYPSKTDIDEAHKIEIPKDLQKTNKFRIIHFGVMYSNLGYDKTVDAVEIIQEKIPSDDIEFLVMGSGAAYEPMKIDIHERNLGNYFILTGWMDYKEALSIMRSGDVGLILFQPGKNNFLRMPNRLYEYCSAGIPFIGSNFEGLQKSITGFEDIGILIDATSPKEIASTIISLYENQTKLAIMKKRAKEAYKIQFYWELEVVKLLDKYEEAFQKIES